MSQRNFRHFSFRSFRSSIWNGICSISTVICCLAIAGTLFAQPNDSFTQPSRRQTAEVLAVAAVQSSVVNIQGDKIEEATPGSGEVNKAFNGIGTGVIIDSRGYVVTNYHVIDGIRNIQVTTADRNVYTATLIARDRDTDLAVIKINTSHTNFPVIRFGRSSDVHLAETVLAIGNPFGYNCTVTRGIVSGLNRDVPVNDVLLYKNAIQTDAAINPGNSGGPLINLDGEMIGVNAAMRQGAQSTAFAIPVDTVLDASAKLIGQQLARSKYHGIQLSVPAFASGRRGVTVNSVEPGSPADIAGLQSGDTIQSVDEAEMERNLDFCRALIGSQVGQSLALEVKRDGTVYKANMVLTGPHAATMAAAGTPYSANRFPTRSTAATGPINPNTGRPAVSSPATSAISSPISAPFTANHPSKPVVSPQPTTTKSSSSANSSSGSGSNGSSTATGSGATANKGWERFGVRVQSISSEEYHQKFADYLEKYPHGAVVIREIQPGSLMAASGVLVGDVLVAFHEWGIQSQENLNYLGAYDWDTLKKMDVVPFVVFRDGNEYSGEMKIK